MASLLTCKGLAKEEQRLHAVPAAGKGQVYTQRRCSKDGEKAPKPEGHCAGIRAAACDAGVIGKVAL